MNDIQRPGIRPFFFMPSFYGLVSWTIWWLLYELRLVRWDPEPALASLLFVVVIVAFCA